MQRRLHGGGANAGNAYVDAKRKTAAAANDSARGQALGTASPFTWRRRVPAAAPGRSICGGYCPAAKLVIEIDGQIHAFTTERDAVRDEYMRSLGLSILRIPAIDVMRNALAVADGLVRLCGPSTTQLR